MTSTFITLVAVVFPAVTLATQSLPGIPLSQVKKHAGKIVTVCGRVVTHDCRETDRTTFLDLDKPYWRKGVAIAISAAERHRMRLAPEDRYLLREVCATGKVEKQNGRYIVSVSDPTQLRIESEPAVPLSGFPPGAARMCDEGVVSPAIVRFVRPTYTRAAAAAHVEGKVFLEGAVLPDGSVGAVRVLHSEFDARLGLEGQAVQAFRESRFQAGKVHDLPATIIVTLEITFVLR